jgi:superfamily II DNA/RNA helicase
LPSNTFISLGVPEDLAAVLSKQGIEAPFPIQAATLADGLAGRDVSGRAPTGSGKTLAFGLVIAAKTQKAKPKRPTALVLVPTRELAAQVAKVLYPLAGARKQHVATVYGGVGYGDQRSALRKGTEILVACPGRLEDLIEQRDVSLSDVSIVVVDEADRMADMGFIPAVKRILDKTADNRQTLLFSATLDGDVDVLVKRYQRDPVRHEVATSEEEQGDVKHYFWRADHHERLKLTADILKQHSTAIVFCRTRHGADRLAKQLSREGIYTAAIHGSRTQPQRDRALEQFQQGRVRALIATDVAARGIHVDDVACVVHYDPPASGKDYVHRSGRTGRAGADGVVVSLVGREHNSAVRAIQKELGMPHRIDPPHSVDRHSSPRTGTEVPTTTPAPEQHRPTGGPKRNGARRPSKNFARGRGNSGGSRRFRGNGAKPKPRPKV